MNFELDITLIAVMGALTVRFAVLTATLPLLDMRSVPPLWRVAIAIGFSLALAPSVVAGLPAGVIDLSWQSLVTEAIQSLVVGIMLGFTVNLLFTTVRYAGSIAGMQIGFAIVNSFDPMSNSQISVISQIYYLMTVLLFFATGAHQIMVGAMFDSCLAVPPFGTMDPSAGSWYLLQQFSDVFTIGLRIAGPIVLVMFLTSVTMGVVVKTVPQINILVVGFPIKIAVGLITFGMALVYFKTIAIIMMGDLHGQVSRVLLAMQ